MPIDRILNNLQQIARTFAAEGRERQMRKHLEQADFDALREAGYLASGLPVDEGGMFENPYTSTAPICEMLRTIAQGDPSVALVAAMHPTVLIPWLIKDKVPEPHAQAWADQRATLFDGVKEGEWWGTITSEPGSGGDVLRTKTTAEPTEEDGRYLLTGDKHFGSGSCLVSYMITTAVAQDDSTPDLFFLDMRNVPEKGAQISAEWDGHGMAATQSHSWRFDGFPATRIAWPGHVGELAPVSGAFGNCAFTAVIVGVVDAAIGAAREQIAPKRDSLRAYEQVEWARVENEYWLITKAYEGLLAETRDEGRYAASALRAKTVIAELAETALGRMCKVLGGGTFSRRAPFSTWAQDVRALGFLRPPWGLAFDQLNTLSETEDSLTRSD